MVKIREWKIVVEREISLNKCPACQFVSKELFTPIKGHTTTTSGMVGQCPRCLSIVRYE